MFCSAFQPYTAKIVIRIQKDSVLSTFPKSFPETTRSGCRAATPTGPTISPLYVNMIRSKISSFALVPLKIEYYTDMHTLDLFNRRWESRLNTEICVCDVIEQMQGDWSEWNSVWTSLPRLSKWWRVQKLMVVFALNTHATYLRKFAVRNRQAQGGEALLLYVTLIQDKISLLHTIPLMIEDDHWLCTHWWYSTDGNRAGWIAKSVKCVWLTICWLIWLWFYVNNFVTVVGVVTWSKIDGCFCFE